MEQPFFVATLTSFLSLSDGEEFLAGKLC